MNWLAHSLLSEPSAGHRIGNLLPDMLSREELKALPSLFAAGIECHRRTDLFTDSHPVVRRTVARLQPAHRRFGGIAADLFYDHFLAVGWTGYCDTPLTTFLGELDGNITACRGEIPAGAYEVMRRMVDENWLGSYHSLDGVRTALRRIGARLRRPTDLSRCVGDLENHYAGFQADFAEFFPQLISHVASWRIPCRAQTTAR